MKINKDIKMILQKLKYPIINNFEHGLYQGKWYAYDEDGNGSDMYHFKGLLSRYLYSFKKSELKIHISWGCHGNAMLLRSKIP